MGCVANQVKSLLVVDNEIEIASSTHQDMHPDPMGYDEELARVIATATMAKNTLPGVEVAAPSTCAWWYCRSSTSSSIQDIVALMNMPTKKIRLDEHHWLHRQRGPQ